MKAIKNMLVVAGLGVLGLTAMWLTRGDAPPAAARETAAPLPPASPVQASAAPPAAQARPAALPQPPELLAAPEEIPGEEGEHGEFTTNTDLMKQKIFKTEPKLAQFDYFREHVLLDSNGRKDYQALLADRAMYEQTRQSLLHPESAKDSMPANVKRLMQVDYLREALAWKENPERKPLLSEVERIILEDSFGPDMAPDVKRSLAATKFELFELLYRQDPERALALAESARGTRLEKLMEYIATRAQGIVAKEKEMSLQAQRARTP
ncbi:MAG TPA: hypothetical protein VFZ09_00760 [Archangium sp.]|uniref:hypothetical protein n=1 Tax=Archangium sp. TaxID=1872627 RepID=UPI002E3246AD|nr:hypothetical protein [Archangium sp.]HEX5744737.1 hypothetical protein [Archangium sp.]